MTRRKSSGFIALAGISALTNAAYATQPPCATSDGSSSTACGSLALANNTTGFNNTAMGDYALHHNSSGAFNTANGAYALINNTVGGYNVAIGALALNYNINGSRNTATGQYALYSNTSGSYNTANGSVAVLHNTTGARNTAVGAAALNNNTTGDSNIALGYDAGYYLTKGNNIDIGNAGAAGDDGLIRIGVAGTQKQAIIAGIVNSKITGSAVYVSASGRLGVLASSERYKTAIASMGSDTAKLQELRPVKFHLKTEPNGSVQYGLIAEEVSKVYPELVIRDERGRIDGVRYDELAPMLLNELQRQAAENRKLKQQVDGIRAELTQLLQQKKLAALR